MGEFSEYDGRALRGADGIVNKIFIVREYSGNDTRSFLLVEGSTDEKLYGRFIDKDRCQIIVTDGKATAVEVISILVETTTSGVLAIVDADFDVVKGVSSLAGNVLFTDEHDLEAMIIKSPALAKILAEFGSQAKIAKLEQDSKKELTTILLQSGLPLGYLRWVSLQDDLSLTFEGLDFEKFVNKEKLVIDIPKLIRTVKNKSQKPALSESDIQSRMTQLVSSSHDPWHVCCGHDLVNILSLGLTKAIGTHDTRIVASEIIEKLLRLAYERSFFTRTQLYTLIRQWEQNNAPFVILSAE